METILLHNLRLPLAISDQEDFSIGDVDFLVQFRMSQYLDIPVTSKLVDFFKSHGLVTKPGVLIADGWSIHVGFEQLDAVSVSDKGYLSQGGYLELFGSEFLEILDNPNQLFNHNVKCKLDIESLEDDVSDCRLKPTVTSHVLETGVVDKILYGMGTRVKFISTEMDDKLRRNWTNPSSKWYITASLSLILTPKSEPNPNSDQDFTIIAGSGTAIRCVRNVLAAQSPYFDRIFQSGMQESGSMTLELPHMSGEGVSAMLDYLYFWNKAEPEVNSLICVELLEAGRQYDVGPMEQCMKQILLSKGDEWYTPDAALRLILFLKDMDLDDLKVRAIEVLKAKIPEVQTLPAFDELIKESPEVIKQLFTFIAAH